MCLIIRRERDGIIPFVHLGTGNYNPVTARIYTDIGFLTSDPVIGSDVTDLFNALTGYSRKKEHNKLLVAPQNMKSAILDRIKQEIEQFKQTGKGHIAFKMNSLQDKDIVRSLYLASQAGVHVDLQVRGICCLRPGVPRVSENIRVTSVVGRFLEHTRIYYFLNGGKEEILMGSADLMPRNLKGRVETLFPVEDRRLLESIRDDILFLHLKDNVKSWELLPDGQYRRVQKGKGETELNSQEYLLKNIGPWHGDD
jgi:polyphosphate kinase